MPRCTVVGVHVWTKFHNSKCDNSRKKNSKKAFRISSILGLSGVKTTFADYGAKMLGDVDRFQRVIQRKRKIGSIGEVGQYPEEFKKIKTFNHETYTLFDETFYHEKSFQYFFCLNLFLF